MKDWLEAARTAAAEIRSRGRAPILVGGTNLYARSYLEGVFDGPGRNDALRTELDAEDSSVLVKRLEAIDPEAAARIHANDRRRLIRAIEVHTATGMKDWGCGTGRSIMVVLCTSTM